MSIKRILATIALVLAVLAIFGVINGPVLPIAVILLAIAVIL